MKSTSQSICWLIASSNFMPTCSECSTAYPTGVVAVRGDAAMAICRECHHRMSKLLHIRTITIGNLCSYWHTAFRIQEVKFLQMSATASKPSLSRVQASQTLTRLLDFVVRASKAPARKKVRKLLLQLPHFYCARLYPTALFLPRFYNFPGWKSFHIISPTRCWLGLHHSTMQSLSTVHTS